MHCELLSVYACWHFENVLSMPIIQYVHYVIAIFQYLAGISCYQPTDKQSLLLLRIANRPLQNLLKSPNDPVKDVSPLSIRNEAKWFWGRIIRQQLTNEMLGTAKQPINIEQRHHVTNLTWYKRFVTPPQNIFLLTPVFHYDSS